MGVLQRPGLKGSVGHVVLGDLARCQHHLNLAPIGGVIAVDGDSGKRLIAEAAVDLGEDLGQQRRILDADVLEGAGIGGEVRRCRCLRRAPSGIAERPSLDISAGLQAPGAAAHLEEVGDGLALRRLGVRVDAGRLVDGRRNALGEPGDDQPAEEQ